MLKLFKTLTILAFLALMLNTFSFPSAQAATAEASIAYGYQDLLGKPLNDRVVTNFLNSYNCAQAGAFQTCNSVGLALWVENQSVTAAYLSAANNDHFAAFPGSLPSGLSADDTLAEVEQALGIPDKFHQDGYLRLVATYHDLGLTIAFNTLSPSDKGATIHHLMVYADPSSQW